MLECSALFFNQLHSVVQVFFFFIYIIPLSCSSSLGLSGEDGVQRTAVLYCPECLCAGDPEVIFHVLVPLKSGVSNRKWATEPKWSCTDSTGLCRSGAYIREGGRNMPLYTLVWHVTLHSCTVSPDYLVPVTWFSHNAFPVLPPKHTCSLSATCSVPTLNDSTKINIGGKKKTQHAPETLL